MITQKRVLWISRHTMTPVQRADLERALGGPVELLPWEETVDDVRELLPMLEGVDAVAAVLPLEKLAELLRVAGSTPVLVARAGRVATGRTLTLPDGRREREFAFEHRGWRQILKVSIREREL